MLHIWSLAFPFFALVLAGFVAARARFLPLESIPGLNGFVLYFALPAMMFRFSYTTPLAQMLDASVVGVYLLSALVMVGLLVWATFSVRMRWNNAAFGAFAATFPNNGFMGVPLLAALLGAHNVGPVIVAFVVDIVFTSSLCVALSRLDMGERGAWSAAKQALRGVVVNPAPWGVCLGALSAYGQVAFPEPVMKTLGMLADAASPVALFTIGTVLARAQLQVDHPMPWTDYVPLALAKLLLHPLWVWGLGWVVISMGVPLSPTAWVTLVLVAALPSASSVSMLAERYGADTGRVARITLVSTVLSFLSLPLAMAWLHR